MKKNELHVNFEYVVRWCENTAIMRSKPPRKRIAICEAYIFEMFLTLHACLSPALPRQPLLLFAQLLAKQSANLPSKSYVLKPKLQPAEIFVIKNLKTLSKCMYDSLG